MKKAGKARDPFVEAVCQRLMPLGEIRPRAMFGGWGLYADERFFALVSRGQLYLKADDVNRPVFLAAGAEPFRPFPDPHASMNYYKPPDTIFESAKLVDWGRMAIDAAGRAPAKRRKARRAGSERFGRAEEGAEDE